MYSVKVVAAAVLFGIVSSVLAGQAPDPASCNQPAPDPVLLVKVPGSPFTPVPTHDGCWIFVTMPMGSPPGVAVYQRGAGKVSLARVVKVNGATGAALTHDDKLLIVTGGKDVSFLDVDRLKSGAKDPVLGSVSDGGKAGSIYVTVTADDQFAFVSDEDAETVTVIDISKARSSGFKSSSIVGKIPVGRAPVGLAVSPNGRYLYSTSEEAPASLRLPAVCSPEKDATAAAPTTVSQPSGRAGRRGGTGGGIAVNAPPAGRVGRAAATANHAPGVLIVVDVAAAELDPTHAVIATVAAQCNPVRVVLSPGGDVAYVSARHEDAVLAFDTGKLLTDSARALIGKVPVGTAPVGLALIDSGQRIVATNSNRFGTEGNYQQALTVVDATRMPLGASAVLGSVPAGLFPRGLRVTADGGALLLANFTSGNLEIIDLARLPMSPPKVP